MILRNKIRFQLIKKYPPSNIMAENVDNSLSRAKTLIFIDFLFKLNIISKFLYISVEGGEDQE